MKSTMKIIIACALVWSVSLSGCSEEKSADTAGESESTEGQDEASTEKAPKTEESTAQEQPGEEEAAKDVPAEVAKAAEQEAVAEKAPAKADPGKEEAAKGEKEKAQLKLDAKRPDAASRQQELQAVYALGRKGDDDSVKGLVDIINSDKEPGIRATAVRVLGRTKRADLVGLLTEQAKSDVLPVKIEAAILLFQWGEKKVAKPVLQQLSAQGVALRRAFLKGRKDGKNQYDPAAKKFLSKGLKSDNVYTKLDAALGLYEINGNKNALNVFKSVMEEADTFYVRMAALNYLRHLKDDASVRAVIEIGTKDKDERVSQRANQILNEQSRGQKVKAKK